MHIELTIKQYFYIITTRKGIACKDIRGKIIIINGKIVTPDIWGQIKDLNITDGLNHLYKIRYFGDLIPTHDSSGKKYDSVFATGVEFDFDIFHTWDYAAEIIQLEYFMRLKHKYNRPYNKQIRKLEDIYEKLKVLNVLHE